MFLHRSSSVSHCRSTLLAISQMLGRGRERLGQWHLATAELEVKSFVSVTYGRPEAG